MRDTQNPDNPSEQAGPANEQDMPDKKHMQLALAQNKFKKGVKIRERRSWYVQVLTDFILAAVFAAILFYFFLIPYEISGNGMEPFADRGSIVFVNRLAYKMGNIKRGDVVSFTDNGHEKIRRIVALPGDIVELIDGILYINGYQIYETYASGSSWTYGGDSRCEVPDGCYYVMCDNRKCPDDSRTFGVVSDAYITGKLAFLYTPGQTKFLSPKE